MSPLHAALIRELKKEYRKLRREALMTCFQPFNERRWRRTQALHEWLLKNPPDGYPYCCKHCLEGTFDDRGECAACWEF